MILIIAYNTLVDIGTVISIICFIGLVIAAVINANVLMNKIGFPTWKEWWEDIKKH